MRATVLLVALVTLLAVCPTGAADGDTLRLVPEWPASFEEARREPMRLMPGPPLAEEATHTAPMPGTSEAGQHSFTWTLENPDGTRGPAGSLPLAADEPVRLDVYVSAGPPDPQPAAQPPAGTDAGLAPSLTVEANLTMAGRTLEAEPVTHTIVNPPGEEHVQRYGFSVDHDLAKLEPGDGLRVEVTVHQVDEAQAQATQPAWRIHTGSQHPTGLDLPLEPGETDPETALGLQTVDQPATPDRVRQGAYAALAASVLAAGWAIRRGYRQLREG